MMKKIYMVFGFLIFIFVFFVIFSKKSINSDINKVYISELMKNNQELKHKFGNIKEYRVQKIVRVYKQKDLGTYDSYTLFVNGEKNNGLIRLNLFKDENGG